MVNEPFSQSFPAPRSMLGVVRTVWVENSWGTGARQHEGDSDPKSTTRGAACTTGGSPAGLPVQPSRPFVFSAALSDGTVGEAGTAPVRASFLVISPACSEEIAQQGDLCAHRGSLHRGRVIPTRPWSPRSVVLRPGRLSPTGLCRSPPKRSLCRSALTTLPACSPSDRRYGRTWPACRRTKAEPSRDRSSLTVISRHPMVVTGAGRAQAS
jgi:hypothetical protein